jgi:hypothetical protein
MTTVAVAPAPGRTGYVRLVFDPQGAERQAAAHCEAAVFLDRFGDGPELLEECFGPHEQDTTWLALLDDSGVAVASARLVVPSAAPTKFEVYLSEEPWFLDPAASMAAVGLDRATTWDVASISVRRRSHGEGALWTAALCHGLFQVARANGVSATVAVLDEGARQLLALNGIVYTTVPGTWTADFCGSPASTPVYADMAAMVAEQRRAFPEAYRLITMGLGLDGVQLPGLAGFRLPPRELDLRGPRLAEAYGVSGLLWS